MKLGTEKSRGRWRFASLANSHAQLVPVKQITEKHVFINHGIFSKKGIKEKDPEPPLILNAFIIKVFC